MQISRRQALGGAGAGLAGLALPLKGAGAAARRRTEVVVIGAGLAGLTAARDLVREGVDIELLEARTRVGGRVLNHSIGDGKVVEIGGQWVGPTQDRILALAKEMGVDTYPTYDEGEYVDYRNGLRVPYDKAIFPLPPGDPVGMAETASLVVRLNEMAAAVDLEAPWETPNAVELDSDTLYSWMERNAVSPGAKQLIQLAAEAILACEPRDVSFLHLLFYIASAGSLENLFLIGGGAQEQRLVGGSQQIPIRMARALGKRIKLGSPVRTIRQTKSGVSVEGDGFAVAAKHVIVAIPPTLAERIEYSPGLPGYRDQMTQRMPMGTVIKTMCVYDTPFWRDEGLTGFATSDTGPVKVTFDNTPPDATPGVLLGFIEGEDARVYGRKTRKERQAGVVESFVRYFGDKAASPRSYIEMNWAAEPYTRGCYSGFFPTGVWTSYGSALKTPIGRIHWAGTETATVWNGYMDGAVQSGNRAAEEVLAAL